MNLKKLIAICFVLVLSTSLVSAYTLLGKKWFSTADFYVNVGSIPSGVPQSDISSAIPKWGSAREAGTTTRGSSNDGVNSISFAKLRRLTLGQTYIARYDSSQVQNCNGTDFYAFTDTDIVLNKSISWANGSCSNDYDLEGVLVHEMGHALGLGHSTVNGATMYPSISACDFSAASLANDDKAGYGHIYSCGGGGGGDTGGGGNGGGNGDKCKGGPKKCPK